MRREAARTRHLAAQADKVAPHDPFASRGTPLSHGYPGAGKGCGSADLCTRTGCFVQTPHTCHERMGGALTESISVRHRSVARRESGVASRRSQHQRDPRSSGRNSTTQRASPAGWPRHPNGVRQDPIVSLLLQTGCDRSSSLRPQEPRRSDPNPRSEHQDSSGQHARFPGNRVDHGWRIGMK
jgi:hypothetical protein